MSDDKKCVISKDVIFDENSFYKTNLEGNKSSNGSSFEQAEKKNNSQVKVNLDSHILDHTHR